MVLIEIEMVTGWEAVSPDRLINEVDSGVQRVETDNEENKVSGEFLIIGYWSLERLFTCVSITGCVLF